MTDLDVLPKVVLYGPGIASGNSLKKAKNVWTLERDCEGHHCAEKNCGAIESSCYDALHLAFCTVVIPSKEGHRFCGIRLGVVSPRGCVIHHWGDNDENRLFQRARKGQPFELPQFIPHLQPDWYMIATVRSCAIKYTVGAIGDELFYFSEKANPKPGDLVERRAVLKIPEKELEMVGYKFPTPATEQEIASQLEPVQKAAEVQAIADHERTDAVAFDNPKSYAVFNKYYEEEAKTKAGLQKEARNVEKAEVAQRKADKAKTKTKAKEKAFAKDFLKKKYKAQKADDP